MSETETDRVKSKFAENRQKTADRRRQLDAFIFSIPFDEIAEQRQRELQANSIAPIPRNPIVGAVADAATGAGEFLNKARLRRHPEIGVGDLLGFEGAGEVLDDASFGFGPVSGKGQTARLDPRVLDVADITPQGIARRLVRDGAPFLAQAFLHASPSPRKFLEDAPFTENIRDIFDEKFIGDPSAGEGATAFGWGFNFAENPAVAGEYASNFEYAGRPAMTFKVDIDDEVVGRMLNWDESIAGNPRSVQEALVGIMPDEYDEAVATGMSGADFLKEFIGNSQAGSQRLKEAGIPGIRFLDQGSRGMAGPAGARGARGGDNATFEVAQMMNDFDIGFDKADDVDWLQRELTARGLDDSKIPEIKNFKESGVGLQTRNITLFSPDDIRSVELDGEMIFSKPPTRTKEQAVEAFQARQPSHDPRFDPRVTQKDRVTGLEIGTEGTPQQAPEIKLSDLEGQPFVTSMSDRTAAGDILTDINGVPLFKPIPRTGGQGFMFENPGMVWASNRGPASNIMTVARKIKADTGQDPLLIPWRMAPSASDFQIMQGEVMLSYAAANMGKGAKRSLNARMKKFIPGWKGVDDPASFGQWRELSADARKQAKAMLDVQFKDKGGLSIGEARAAISDPTQFNARDAGTQNVGRIFADDELIASGNVTFSDAIPGEGVGTLGADVGIFELLPEIAESRGLQNPRFPKQTDIRSMQMGAKSGIITPDILKKLSDRGVDVGALPLVALVGAATAYGLLGEQEENTL